MLRKYPAKAKSNERKHKVSFSEAQTVFSDAHALELPDEVHDDRECVIGRSSHDRTLFVVAIEMSETTIRIISARKATAQEEADYEASY